MSVGEAGWVTAHTEKRPVTDWSVTIGILSTPDLRKEHPESTSVCQQEKNIIQRQSLCLISVLALT